jgi:hypothetical protein
MLLCFHVSTVCAADLTGQTPPTTHPSMQNQVEEPINGGEANMLGRGSYRSPRGSFTGGNRGGISPGVPGGPASGVSRRAPNTGQTGSPFGRFGGFLGGALTGVFLGHILNPFGYGNGAGGFSFIGLLFWVLIIYLGYKLIQRFRRRHQ